MGERKSIHLKWIHTSDIHGDLFGYNYRNSHKNGRGLSSIYSYICQQRREYGDRLVVTDGGDCLQGQPLAYYYNFIDTGSPHLVAEVMNEMGYVCGVMGNHDIEVGIPTFERWMQNCKFPILGANVIADTHTNKKPYLQPYIVFNCCGIKIAVLGMVTPIIPYYQPNTLWPNLSFEEILPSVKRWVDCIQEQEHPDILVGLFHSGFEGGFCEEEYCHENSVKEVAEQISGFDLICYGHDHLPAIHRIKNVHGNEVVCMGATCTNGYFTEAEIDLTIKEGRIETKSINGKVLSVNKNSRFLNKMLIKQKYSSQLQKVAKWASSSLCELVDTLREQEAYFGPCRFMDYIHQIQIDMTGAEISFATPFSYDSRLNQGVLCVGDLFPILAYEEFVYKLRLTGDEIKGMLEMSYGKWVNTMNDSYDRFLQISNINANVSVVKKAKRLVKRLFFDRNNATGWRLIHTNSEIYSASGIVYTVDVSKPIGNRVSIISMADGTSFLPQKEYSVAINRRLLFNKEGLISKGAGLSHKELPQRIISISDKALPYFMMHQMATQKVVCPKVISQWRFIPEHIVSKAMEKDKKLLFPSNLLQKLYFKLTAA